MSNQAITDDVLERVRKILRLASDKGATEAEAATAMARASEILARYNLNVTEFKSTEEKKRNGARLHVVRSPNNRWAIYLWAAAAELNACKYVADRRVPGMLHHLVIGRPVNAEATRLMASYLVTAVERLAREHPLAGGDRAFRWAFKNGCAGRILERAREIAETRRHGKAQVMGDAAGLPALIDQERLLLSEADAAFAEAGLGAKQKKGRAVSRVSLGAVLGSLAGNDVGLDTQVAGPGAAQQVSDQS